MADDVLAQTLAQIAAMGSVGKSKVNSPDVRAFAPGAATNALAAQATTNPYALGHFVGSQRDDEYLRKQYEKSLMSSNALASATASNVAQSEGLNKLQIEALKQNIPLNIVLGLGTEGYGAESAPVTEFGAMQQAALQASGMKDAGAGALSFANAGQPINIGQPTQQGLGIDVGKATPLGVREAAIRSAGSGGGGGGKIKAQVRMVNGTIVDVKGNTAAEVHSKIEAMKQQGYVAYDPNNQLAATNGVPASQQRVVESDPHEPLQPEAQPTVSDGSTPNDAVLNIRNRTIEFWTRKGYQHDGQIYWDDAKKKHYMEAVNPKNNKTSRVEIDPSGNFQAFER